MSKIGNIIDNIKKVGKFMKEYKEIQEKKAKSNDEFVGKLQGQLEECEKARKKGGKGTKKKNKKFRKSRKKISHNKNNGSKNRFNRRQHRRRENHNIQ